MRFRWLRQMVGHLEVRAGFGQEIRCIGFVQTEFKLQFLVHLNHLNSLMMYGIHKSLFK